jgi:Protein of unknown function (DUF3631)
MSPPRHDPRGHQYDYCTSCGADLSVMKHLDWCTTEYRAQRAGSAVLDTVYETVTGFVIWPSKAAPIAYTLWIAATHAQPAWEHASRFVVKSPIKRCGKTRLQEIGRELIYKPLSTSNISVAALVRSIDEKDPPTLILDEADSIFGRKNKDAREGAEDLRGILNSGHSRGWPYIRWDPHARQRDECPTFAMALVGGIGDLPDTIEDRAVVVSMRRRAPGEPVRQFRRRRVLSELHALRDRLSDWVVSVTIVLVDAEPDLPVEDREADVWEPLIAVADAAGGHWPETARDACRELCGGSTLDEGTLGERLLADLADVWGDEEEHLPTATLLERLKRIEEAPWDEGWGTPPKPLSARSLARLLRPYGISSRTVRVGDDTPKGYAREDLADAWRRYATSATPRHRKENPASTREDGRGGAVADSGFESATRSDQGTRDACGAVADVADARLERAHPNGKRCELCDVADSHADWCGVER